MVGEDGAILSSSASSLQGSGDTDLDGLDDLIEHYFGTPIEVPNASPLVLLDTGMIIQWPEVNVAGLTVTIEWSPDLKVWLGSGESANGVPARTITLSTSGVGTKQATLEGPTSAAAYLRLRATAP